MPINPTYLNIFSVFCMGQLPQPQSYEGDKKKKVGSLDKDNFQNSVYRSLTRDPLQSSSSTSVTTTRTKEEEEARNAIIALTRNSSLPDDGRRYNAGLLCDFLLKFGGIYTQDALELAKAAIKPGSEGGLGLKISLGKNRLPDGTFTSDKYPGKKFMLQFQDNSIFVQDTFGPNNIPIGEGATYVRNLDPETKKYELVLDKNRKHPLIGTEALTNLCAYPVQDLSCYTINLTDKHKDALGFTGFLEIVPEIDGSLFITEYTSSNRTEVKRQGIYYNDGSKWVLKEGGNPYRTTAIIRQEGLSPIAPMKTLDFHTLSGYNPDNYTKEIQEVIGNYYSICPKAKDEPSEPSGRPPEPPEPLRVLPSVGNAFIQAFTDKKGNHYIVSKNDVFRIKKTNGGATLEIYDFTGKKKGFIPVTGPKLYQLHYILRYGNHFPPPEPQIY